MNAPSNFCSSSFDFFDIDGSDREPATAASILFNFIDRKLDEVLGEEQEFGPVRDCLSNQPVEVVWNIGRGLRVAAAQL